MKVKNISAGLGIALLTMTAAPVASADDLPRKVRKIAKKVTVGEGDSVFLSSAYDAKGCKAKLVVVPQLSAAPEMNAYRIILYRGYFVGERPDINELTLSHDGKALTPFEVPGRGTTLTGRECNTAGGSYCFVQKGAELPTEAAARGPETGLTVDITKNGSVVDQCTFTPELFQAVMYRVEEAYPQTAVATVTVDAEVAGIELGTNLTGAREILTARREGYGMPWAWPTVEGQTGLATIELTSRNKIEEAEADYEAVTLQAAVRDGVGEVFGISRLYAPAGKEPILVNTVIEQLIGQYGSPSFTRYVERNPDGSLIEDSRPAPMLYWAWRPDGSVIEGTDAEACLSAPNRGTALTLSEERSPVRPAAESFPATSRRCAVFLEAVLSRAGPETRYLRRASIRLLDSARAHSFLEDLIVSEQAASEAARIEAASRGLPD